MRGYMYIHAKMKKKKTIFQQLWFWLLVGALVCSIICCFPIWFTGKGLKEFVETGQIGDTIGGIMGPFVAMVAAFLTFIAFWVQKKANDAQRQDIKVERFNANFYNLLDIHEQITDSLDMQIMVTEGAALKSIKCQGRALFYHTFEDMYEEGADVNFIGQGMRGRLAVKGIESYVESELPTYFDHYFRNLYRIVKYVDETDVFDNDEVTNNVYDEKYKYVAILRSTLSRYELIWLFYNALSPYGNIKFKPLIEEYALLKNIRPELLVKPEHYNLYNECAYHKKNRIEK